MQNEKKESTSGVMCALSTLTNLGLPERQYSEKAQANAFFYYPATALLKAIPAAAAPLAVCAWAGQMHGITLLSCALYIFLLEWLSGFKAMSQFAMICGAAGKTHMTHTERLEYLSAAGTSPAAVACTAMLACAKFLTVYLLFLRLAIFGSLAFLAFVLIFTPPFAQLCVLWMANGKKRLSITLSLIINFVLLCLAGCMYFGLCRTAEVFVTADSISLFFRALTLLAAEGGINAELLKSGAGLMFYILLACLTIHLIWTMETRRLFKSIPEQTEGAVSETAELAVMATFLMLADMLAL